MRRIPRAAAVLLLAAATASAQAPPSPTPAFPSRADLVNVDVVVVDDAGQPVAGLTRDDFTIAEEGTRRTAGELLDAHAVAAEARSAAGAFFRRYDILLCPASAALAWPADTVFPPEIDGRPVGPRGHAVFTGWMNVTGLPAVTVPVAMTEREGGIGLQLVAAHGRDRDLLDFVATTPALRAAAPAPLAHPE